jgi:hypothetical protein
VALSLARLGLRAGLCERLRAGLRLRREGIRMQNFFSFFFAEFFCGFFFFYKMSERWQDFVCLFEFLNAAF